MPPPAESLAPAQSVYTPGLCSVIIPCFHADAYIRQALESVRAQSYAEWEIIVIEDASHDRTEHLVRIFAASVPDHRVEFARHESNEGVSGTRNTALSEAKGEFVGPLDHDDRWLPGFLKDSVATLETTASDVAFSDVWVQGAARETMDERRVRDFDARQTMHWLLERNQIVNSATLIRREALDAVGFYDQHPKIQHAEDYDLWLRLAAAGRKFARVAKTNAVYREHASQASSNHSFLLNQTANVLMKHLRSKGTPWQLTARRAALLYQEVGMMNWEKHPHAAIKSLFRAAKLQPFNLQLWWLLAKLIPRVV
jgi:teichuronic acid biosynthesis glycosyltransferase TuaG